MARAESLDEGRGAYYGREQLDSHISMLNPDNEVINRERARYAELAEMVIDKENWQRILLFKMVLEHYLYGGTNLKPGLTNVSKLDLGFDEDRQKWREYLQVIWPNLMYREVKMVRRVVPENLKILEFFRHEILQFASHAKSRNKIQMLLSGPALAIPLFEEFRAIVGPGLADDFLIFLKQAAAEAGPDLEVMFR